MEKVYILEVWHSGAHSDNGIKIVGAFKSLDKLEIYKKLNPVERHLNYYYKESCIKILD